MAPAGNPDECSGRRALDPRGQRGADPVVYGDGAFADADDEAGDVCHEGDQRTGKGTAAEEFGIK